MKAIEQRPTIVLVHDKNHKEQWERDLAFFLPDVDVMPFPITEKSHSLRRRAAGKSGAADASIRCLITR